MIVGASKQSCVSISMGECAHDYLRVTECFRYHRPRYHGVMGEGRGHRRESGITVTGRALARGLPWAYSHLCAVSCVRIVVRAARGTSNTMYVIVSALGSAERSLGAC